MKSFKQHLNEILEPTTSDIQPTKETNNDIQLTRSYETKIGDDIITTNINHIHSTNTSDVKFYVNGSTSKIHNKNTKETLNIFNTILNHIKHHIENTPTKVQTISYTYIDSPQGSKKNKLYQMIGKKFNIKLDPKPVKP
jgi:hypothetical protein